MELSGIYSITVVPTGDKYIGSSESIRTRFRIHRAKLRSKTHYNSRLQELWDKFKEEDFLFETIEIVEDPEERVIREQYYLDLLGSLNKQSANKAPAKGRIHSVEARLSISEANKGKIISEISRKRMSDAQKLRAQDPEYIEKQRVAMLGNQNLLGYKFSDESKAKISASNKGRGKGRHLSEETKQKLRENHKVRTGWRKKPKESKTLTIANQNY